MQPRSFASFFFISFYNISGALLARICFLKHFEGTEEFRLDEKAVLLMLPLSVVTTVFSSFFMFLLVDPALLLQIWPLCLTVAPFSFGRNGPAAVLKQATLATLERLRLRRRCGRAAA